MRQTATFLTAEWRDLAMLNYEIEPAALAPRVPYRTELDSWGGRTFVSVVVFVKEIVPRRAIAWLARVLYNENYFALPMRHEITRESDARSTGRASYRRFQGERWHELAIEFAGTALVPPEDSEEAFITEHYWGYARQRDGGTVEDQVEHPRWSVLRASAAALDCDVASFYRPTFAPFLCGPPSSAFIAGGSAVTVRRGALL